MKETAKLFMNGRSQAVRLPAEFRFEGEEVFIRRDKKTGDVIISSKPNSWDDFFKLQNNSEIPDDFMEGRNQDEIKDKDLF